MLNTEISCRTKGSGEAGAGAEEAAVGESMCQMLKRKQINRNKQRKRDRLEEATVPHALVDEGTMHGKGGLGFQLRIQNVVPHALVDEGTMHGKGGLGFQLRIHKHTH